MAYKKTKPTGSISKSSKTSVFIDKTDVITIALKYVISSFITELVRKLIKTSNKMKIR